MPRPRLPRKIDFSPNVTYFKPRGVPLRELDEVVIYHDELEALRLYKFEGLNQIESAQKMRISQPTFTRIVNSAYKKIANALIKGKAIKIHGR